MRPCIECGTPTEGSIGQAGMKWSMLCQNCKDLADRELAQSIAKMAAAIDYALPRCFPAADGIVLDGNDYCGAVSDCTCGKIGCPSRQPSPSTPEAA